MRQTFITAISSLFLLMTASPGFAQVLQEENTNRIQISDFSFQLGFIAGDNIKGTLENFRDLAPESTMLYENFEGFSQRFRFLNFGPQSMFGILMGFEIRDKSGNNYRSHPLLRIGAHYTSGSGGTYNLQRIDRTPYDTLTSSQTGQQTFIDSIYRQSYQMDYRFQQVSLDVSLLFRTNPASRWSAYSGIGFTGGVSIKAETEIHYGTSRDEESRNDQRDYYSFYDDADESRSEYHTNDSRLAMSVYVPVGVNFRLGKKKEFWQRLHAFVEMRPGVHFVNVPELGNFTSGYFQQGFGLRAAFD